MTNQATADRDRPVPTTPAGIAKAPTGIGGLDEVTGGGLPRGRPTLVTGSAGSGKTLLGIEFLVHGALDHGEPGVLLAFEESSEDLATNVASLGFDLKQMETDGLLVIDAFQIDVPQLIETGAYDLEGLFVRLANAVDSIGAKRVVLDTLDVLFGALENSAIVRTETARLFRWLRDRGLTVIVTGERTSTSLTHYRVEEYVSDCVIVLDHRITEELSTRRLRVVKYRGSQHGTNEYPFLVGDRGLAVLPLSSLRLDYPAPAERVSTGLERLDHMLGGGIYRSSSVLISGEAGTGKTTLAAGVIASACSRGERALLVNFEESPAQLMRNMASVGLDLQRWVDAGLLQISASRPGAYGLEQHLANLMHTVETFAPAFVALDATVAMTHVGSLSEVVSLVTRQVDLLKSRGITAVFTSLVTEGATGMLESPALDITSLMDTWLLLRNTETNGERNRLLFVRKSRGSAHSNQVREFVLTDSGPDLLDVYVGPEGVLTGSARLAQAGEERRSSVLREQKIERRRQQLHRRTQQVEAQIEALRTELASEAAEIDQLASESEQATAALATETDRMATLRWQDPATEVPLSGQGS